MTKRSIVVPAATLSALALAACGGGGGGGGVLPDGGSAPAASTVVVGQGGVSSVPPVFATGATPVTVANQTYPGYLTVARPRDSDPAAVNGSLTNNSATRFDVTLDMRVDGANSVERFTTANVQATAPDVLVAEKVGSDGFTYDLLLGGMDTLSYARWGLWARHDGNDTLDAGDAAAAFFGGRETPLAAMPNLGSASYLGTTGGLSIDRNGNFEPIAGTVNLTANFGAATITGAVDGLRNSTNALLDARGVLSGNITGNGFAGTVQGTNQAGTSPLGSGVFDGKFFGPVAQEVAGKWNFESGDGTKLLGAFGARR
jgi:hypothetical protein